jgi:hypothetical protein
MRYGAEVDKQGEIHIGSRSKSFYVLECQICTKDNIPSEKTLAQNRGFYSCCHYLNACVLLLGTKRMCICCRKVITELEFDIALSVSIH